MKAEAETRKADANAKKRVTENGREGLGRLPGSKCGCGVSGSVLGFAKHMVFENWILGDS